MKKLLYSLFIVLAVVACGGKDPDPVPGPNPSPTPGGGGGGITTTPTITLQGSSMLSFSSEGGQSDIYFTSSVDWTASMVNDRASEWCWIAPTSGTAGNGKITIKTTENNTPDDRSATILIKAGNASKAINVSQKQKDAITITSSTFEIDNYGGEIEIEVQANIDFEFSIDEGAQDWIWHTDTRSMNSYKLVFYVNENPDAERREANITFKSGELSEVVTIYQAGAEPTIILSQYDYYVASDGETISVDVTSNVDVSIEIPEDATWITENYTRGTSTNTYYFDIAENRDESERTATIIFRNGDRYEYLYVHQWGITPSIIVSQHEFYLSSEGETISVDVTSNVDVTIEIPEDANWVTLSETRGTETNTFHFDIAENGEQSERSTNITFRSGEYCEHIYIYQSGFYPSISFSQGEFYLSSEGETISVDVTSNVDVTIEIPEDANWVTLSETRGTETNTFHFDIAENMEQSERSTNITFRSGDYCEYLYIYQYGMYPSISFSQRDYYLSPESQTITVEVTSNVEFTIEIDEWATSWITQTSTRGTTTNTYYFNIAQNEETWTRGASITFSYGDNYWDYIYVEQRGTDPVIIRSPMEYYITSAGKSIAIEVAEYLNVAVEIPSDVSWITRNTTQQTASNVYCFDIAKNETYDMRYAEIIFTDTDRNYSERVKISQNAIEVLDIKSPTEYDLTKEGGEITIELESSIDFDVVVSNPWIRRVETPNTRAITTNSYTFDIAANINPTQREGTIVFKAKVGDFSQTVKISQQRGDTNIESPEDGGDYEWQN